MRASYCINDTHVRREGGNIIRGREVRGGADEENEDINQLRIGEVNCNDCFYPRMEEGGGEDGVGTEKVSESSKPNYGPKRQV